MKTLIFVMESFPPEMSANVTCALNIANELKKKFRIICICGTKNKNQNKTVKIIDELEVHYIYHKSFSDKMNSTLKKIIKIVYKLFHFLKSICVLSIFPNVEPIYSYKIYKELKKISKLNEINCIISFFRPFSPIAAMLKFKRKNRDVVCVSYMLDVLRGAKPPFGVSSKNYLKMCINAEAKVFKNSDYVFLPIDSVSMYNSNKFKDYNKKIIYMNFPVLKIKEKNVSKDNNLLKIIYAGTTDNSYRNPINFIKILSEINIDNKEVRFELYGKTNMLDELNKVEKDYSNIFKYYGLVNKEEIENKMYECDYIVNMGNNIEGMVPSKTFEIMGYMKPIIHLTHNSGDSSIKYISNYPDSIILNENDEFNENVEKLHTFFVKQKSIINSKEIIEKFENATPEYVAKTLEQILEER